MVRRYLVVHAGPERGRRHQISEGEVTVGREPGNHVVIADGQVSRRHAVLRIGAQSVEVVDLNSTNGTFLNGGRVTNPRPLRPGDLLRMGQTELVLELEDAAETAVAAPPPRPSTAPLPPSLALGTQPEPPQVAPVPPPPPVVPAPVDEPLPAPVNEALPSPDIEFAPKAEPSVADEDLAPSPDQQAGAVAAEEAPPFAESAPVLERAPVKDAAPAPVDEAAPVDERDELFAPPEVDEASVGEIEEAPHGPAMRPALEHYDPEPAPAFEEPGEVQPAPGLQAAEEDEVEGGAVLDAAYARRVLVASVVLVALIIFVIVVLVVAQ